MILYLEKPFFCNVDFSRVFGEVFLFIRGVEHVLSFVALFRGC